MSIDKGSKTVGQIGEDLACEYLKRNGFKIILRNHRQAFGEIDIIAKETATNLVVFVEVKALVGNCETFRPEDHYNQAKRYKTARIVQYYAVKHSKDIDPQAGWRIDLIAVGIAQLPIKNRDTEVRIAHYENV